MTLKIAKWLFLLLIVSLPLVRPFNTTISGLQIPCTDLIFFAVFTFWLISLLRRETNFRFDKFYYFLAFYGFALTISTVFSVQPQKSFFKLIGEFYLFSLAVLTFNLVQDKSFFKRIIIAWLVGTSLTILASIAGFALFYLGYKTQADNYFLSHFGSLPAGNYPRIHALFANANMMCNFLNVSFLLAILTAKMDWIGKVWANILIAGIFFATFFTFSAGVGGMILGSGIWLWNLLKHKPFSAKFALISTIILAILIFGSTLVSPDTNNTTQDFKLPLTEKKLESSVRVLVWENAFERGEQFPLFGKGTGTDAAMLPYETLSGDHQILLDAHNVWLNIFGQTGLFGLLAFILLSVFLTTKCRFLINKPNEQNFTHLAFSCTFLGAFLYQGLSGSFEDARHLWILFGMLVGISSISENDISEASTEP